MRPKPLRAPALALLLSGALLCTSALPARAASHRRPPSVPSALRALLSAGAIEAGAYDRYTTAYAAAQRSLGRLHGTRHEELAGVIANVRAMAAAGELIPSRLPALFLTLERNREWWTSGQLLSSGQRVGFPESGIVWEYYPEQGIEIQWLATFGKANGYYLSGEGDEALRALLDEVIPLATQRAGGIAWEYMFRFDGGRPPWTSGLSQGTAIQALARASQRLKEPAFLTAAKEALGIFQTPPPAGVRVATPAGAEYAEYTYAPKDRILNGFVQSLVGLYDYTSISGDPLGVRLFSEGDAEARAEVPAYDTGGWSLYDQYGESNLNYHELLTEFLDHLCQRTETGSPGLTVTRGAPSTAIPGDQIYCTTAQRFTADLHTPPAIALLSHAFGGGVRAGVKMSLSKISTITLTVREGVRVVWSNRATVEHGDPRLLWITPRKGGTFKVELSAVDLAGNRASTSGTIVVTPASPTKRTPPRGGSTPRRK
ncbi:MAG TPA: D-glucuronyl C5-epimerase family protein [Solirubrobacteraceae bacterium]|jgi:hypothetical protein|nr:D-glucuronyl C5-epimerase family protein [Solirubrobacteraceae bacterium]